MDGGGVPTRSRDLLERTRELERIDFVLHAAIAGDGRALLIEGPSGIGKTALLDAACRRAKSQGITVLSARGGELEAQYPFGAVRQLFEPVVHRASSETRAQLLAGPARLCAPIVSGEDPGSAGGADPGFAHLHGLYWLTVNLATDAPVLITIDDVHWVDPRSLRFLLYLLGRLDGLAVGLVASARPGERGRSPGLAARLAADRQLELVKLAPLSERAVGQLLAAGLQRTPDDPFVAACTAATGGVPFLVQELASALVSDHVEPTAKQASSVERLGPPMVARWTAVRLARMPKGAVPLARSIAVLGRDAQLHRAARLAALDEPVALAALDALVASEIVRADEQLEFVHPIVRAAVYDETAPGERSRLHRQAARLLSAEGAELDAVATQLLASAPSGSQDVIEQLREAGAAALARGASEAAVAYLSRALREGCERELRATISFELATAERLAGQPRMIKHFEDAHRLAMDPVLRNTAALELASALALLGEHDTPMALVQAALEDLGDRSPELAVRLECFRAAMAASDPRLVAEFDRRLPMLHSLVENSEGPAGAPARSLALLLAAVSAWRGDDAGKVLSLVERGWSDGRALADGGDLWALGQGLGALVISDQLARAGELTDALLADAEARGSVARYGLACAYRGFIETRQGRVTAAEAWLRPAIDGVRERALFALGTYLWIATDVILERPDAGDLAGLAEAIELGPMGEVHAGALLLEVRGRTRYALGRTAAAIEDLRRAGEIFEALGTRSPNGSSWRSALALMLGAEHRDEALGLARGELEDARDAGHARAIGVALRALGVLEGGAGGRELLAQAATVLEGSAARLEYARALVELGAAARRAGERAAARGPLRTALDIAVETGATRLAERARAELESSGAHPRRERITGRDALTPSELRVARLVAEGRTNNEVAQALFVTPKTVDTHLSRVYAKLGISSRRDLAAALESNRAA